MNEKSRSYGGRTVGREASVTLFGNSVERKPRALIESFEGDCIIQSFSNFPHIPGLREAAVIDVARRYPEFITRIQHIPNQTEQEYEKRYSELIERAKDIEISERIVNGVKVGFIQRLEQTGEKILEISEDPKHPDHGWPHVRRVKIEAHRQWPTYPDLHHDGFRESLMIALFAEYHDKGQLPALLWNKENPNTPIKIKAGHAEEGGIFVELLQNEIQKAGAMTESMAKEISALTSILIFLHDIPERMIEKVHGTVKANWMDSNELKSLSEVELFDHYDIGDLNMFTTSPSQRLLILQHVKREKKVLNVGERNWGIHPEVESAYKKELLAMSMDTTPTFLDVSQDVMAGVIDAATICLHADMKDMMASVKAQVRKFNVNASMDRGIYKADEGVLVRILGNVGDDMQSDYERAMWEILEYIRLNKVSRVWGDTDSRNEVIRVAINSLSSTHKFFLELMKGEDGLYVIDESLTDRLFEIGIKAIGKTKIPKEHLKNIETDMGDLRDPSEIDSVIRSKLSQLKLPSAPKYLRRYKSRSEAIVVESETAKIRIREKHDNDNGQAHAYSKREMEHASTVYEQLVEHFADLVEMSMEELNSRLNETRSIFSNDSFDSVGGIADIKTLIPLTLAQEKLIKRIENEGKQGNNGSSSAHS